MKKIEKRKIGKRKIEIILALGILFFILKLFLFSFQIRSCGGSSLRMMPCIEYSWILSSTLSVIFLILLVGGYFLIKKGKLKIILLSILLIVSILGKQIFFLLSPEFKFYFSPAKNYYLNDTGELDVDKYLFYMDKYCHERDMRSWIFLRQGRFSMCEKGKYVYQWDTTEQYIKVFEYYKEHNERYLYGNLLDTVDTLGKIEDIILSYKDKTFQAKVIYELFWYNDKLEMIKQNNVDKDILDLLEFTQKEVGEYEKIKNSLNTLDWRKMGEEIRTNIYEKIKTISEINHKIF